VPVQAFAAEDGHDHTVEDHELLQSIQVTTLPDKVEYVQGEELDVTGGVITLNYGDAHAHEMDMTEEMVTGFDTAVTGVQTLTVTWEGMTDTFDVTVTAAVAPLSDHEDEEPAESQETEPAESQETEPQTTEPQATESQPSEPEHTHIYMPVVTDPTCTVAGFTTFTCECGDSYTDDEIAATGHSYESVVVEPTAEKQGYTEHTCTVCGDTYQDTFTDFEKDAESELLQQMRGDIAAFVEQYGLEPGMSQSDLANTYIYLDGNQAYDCWVQMNDLLERSKGLSAAEGKILQAEENTQLALRFYDVVVILTTPMILADPIDLSAGVTVSVDHTDATLEEITGGVKASITGKGDNCTFDQPETTHITITNTSGSKAKLTFDYSATNHDLLSCSALGINNTNYRGTNGSCEITLDAGAAVIFTLQSRNDADNGAAILELTNFVLVEDTSSHKVTVIYDKTLGSVTVNGKTVESDTAVDISTANAALVANAGSNVFIGWADEDNKIYFGNQFKTASQTVELKEDLKVKAIFQKKGGNAWYQVGDYLFDNLTDAHAFAVAGTAGKTIVVASDGILPAGDYTIDSGVTLLVPYDAAYTDSKDKPATEDAYTKPTAFRTLTMAKDANLTIDGVLSLSSKMSARNATNGAPSGPTSFIHMNEGSNITVNGTMYAWGYVTGSGTVTANDSASVYECFQATDWRGGNATAQMVDNSYKVFPMSQYYVQNIEVPMTLYAGAKEYGYTAVTISWPVGTQDSDIPFIGPEGMFNITSGYIVKDYIESQDRLSIDVHGGLSMKGISMSLNLGALSG